MSISFHCESCKKKVKAPDNAGGRWGACPHCKHRCYIPMPRAGDEEELKLVPLEEDFETKYGQLMRETHDLTRNILHQKESADNGPSASPEAGVSERQLIKDIVIYLRLMADGELAQAEDAAQKITKAGKTAKNILARMLRTEQPEPELADIAPRVLQALIKDLNAKI